jgi:hypothetical protein
MIELQYIFGGVRFNCLIHTCFPFTIRIFYFTGRDLQFEGAIYDNLYNLPKDFDSAEALGKTVSAETPNPQSDIQSEFSIKSLKWKETGDDPSLSCPLRFPASKNSNSEETVPIVITSLSTVTIAEAACGDSHLLLRSDTGDVYAFGVGSSGQLGLGEERLFVKRPEKIRELPHNICQVSAGARHSVALSSQVAKILCVSGTDIH